MADTIDIDCDPDDASVSPYPLRSYQIEALEHVSKRFLEGGISRLLVEHPTGLGKTVLAASLLRQPAIAEWLATFPSNRRRLLFLAHRRELLEQAAQKFRAVNPSLRVEVEQGDQWATKRADVIVASVATLAHPNGSRLNRIDPEDVRIVVVDEAHHAVAPSYRRVLAPFGFCSSVESGDLVQGTGRLLLGVTATPNRSDGQGLQSVFDEIAHSLSLQQMIEDGHLSRLRAYQVMTTTSVDDVPLQSGDFVTAALSRAVNTAERNASAVDAYLRFGDDRQALVFAVDVAHASALANCFEASGVAAATVSGATSLAERSEAIARFRSGAIRVLTNCMVLTEGFDAPELSCVVMARPTKSALLYRQMIGRGTRVAPLKTDCLILDLIDNTSKHSLQTMGTLLGLGMRHQFNGGDVLTSQAQRRTVEDRFGDDYEIPQTLSDGELRLLAVAVPLWADGDAPPHWVHTARGAYVVEAPKRERLERFVIRPAADGTWFISRVALARRHAILPGFDRHVRRQHGLALPQNLRRPFESAAAAQEAVLTFMGTPRVPRPPVYPGLGELLTREGRMLLDRTRPFWQASAPSSVPSRAQGKTHHAIVDGALVLATALPTGRFFVFGQVVFGHGYYDAYLRVGAGLSFVERLEKVVNAFALADAKWARPEDPTARELSDWFRSGRDYARLTEVCDRERLI